MGAHVGLIVEHFPDLGISRVSRWCFNCYLITGDDGALVVVDPGMPSIADDLAPLLATMPGRLRLVTATHGHPDHLGGAPTLAARHGAEIHLPSTTLTYLDGAVPRTPSVAKIARTWPLLFGQPFDVRAAAGFIRASATTGFGTSRGMLWRATRPAGGLLDGQPLPFASSWTVLNSPGHTDDSIALWHERTRTLLSGDAVLAIGRRPRFAPDTIDELAATRTADRLRALPVEHLLPGHGSPLHDAQIWTL